MENTVKQPTECIDWDLKEFSLTVESYDVASAIAKMESAINKLKTGDVSFSRRSTLIGDVSASYSYPRRPHCTLV